MGGKNLTCVWNLFC